MSKLVFTKLNHIGGYCLNNHLLTEENTFLLRDSIRCRTCKRETDILFRQRKRAAQPGSQLKSRYEIGDLCGDGHIIDGDNLKVIIKRGKESYRCLKCYTRMNTEAKRRARALGKEGTKSCGRGHLIEGDNLVWRKRKGKLYSRCLTCERTKSGHNKEKNRTEYRDYRAERLAAIEHNKNLESGQVRRQVPGGMISSWRSKYFNALRRQVEETEDLAKRDDERPNAPWNLLRPKPFARESWEDFQDELTAGRREKVYPLCKDRPEDFMDYAERDEEPAAGQKSFPSRYDAEALCEECPFLVACRTYARIEQPTWGVHGGERYIPDGNDKTGYKGKRLF